jgi:hypothetical protein
MQRRMSISSPGVLLQERSMMDFTMMQILRQSRTMMNCNSQNVLRLTQVVIMVILHNSRLSTFLLSNGSNFYYTVPMAGRSNSQGDNNCQNNSDIDRHKQDPS